MQDPCLPGGKCLRLPWGLSLAPRLTLVIERQEEGQTNVGDSQWLSELILSAFVCNQEAGIEFLDLCLVSAGLYLDGMQDFVTHHVLVDLNLVGAQTGFELLRYHVQVPLYRCRVGKIVVENLLVQFQNGKTISFQGELLFLAPDACWTGLRLGVGSLGWYVAM